MTKTELSTRTESLPRQSDEGAQLRVYIGPLNKGTVYDGAKASAE